MIHFLFVYKRQFRTTRQATTIRAVVCDRCATEYFYPMTRIAIGHGTAVYGIGREAAARQADRSSQKKLDQMMEHDVDLVPCPQCQWINDDMARQYVRQENGPHLVKLLPLLACAFIAGMMYVVNVLGNPNHHEARQFTQYALNTLLVGVGLTALVYLIQWLKILLFNPNRPRRGNVRRYEVVNKGLLPVIDPKTGQTVLVTAAGKIVAVRVGTTWEHKESGGII